MLSLKSLAPKLSISLPESLAFVSAFISTERLKAQNFVANHRIITINNVHTTNVRTVRPLINPTQRLILSNVSPSIPHEYIEKFLTNINIRMTSKLTFLRTGIQETNFTHIMSFRRQYFVNPDDLPKIRQSFLVNHDNTQYRIFASTDKLNCFLCKQEGHVAKYWSNSPQSTATNQEETMEPKSKLSQDVMHEYTNRANNTNIPPNILNITEIATNSR